MFSRRTQLRLRDMIEDSYRDIDPRIIFDLATREVPALRAAITSALDHHG